MKKTLTIILSVVMVLSCVFAFSACGPKDDFDGYEVTVLVKATESDFWANVAEGAKDYMKDHPNVRVTIQGPAAEVDTDKSLTIFDNAIISKPDAIVVASNAGKGAVPRVKKAKAAGIKVISIDTAIPSDDLECHLATDNIKGGKFAAQAMVESLKKQGRELKGDVAILSALNCETTLARDKGFIDEMEKIAPNITVLDRKEVNGTTEKAVTYVKNIIGGYKNNPDQLLGIYGDNNQMGEAIYAALKTQNLADKITAVCFDNSIQEIKGLNENVIKALIVQDQHNMGYKGVEYAVKAIEGKLDVDYLDTGVNIVWPEDLTEEDLAKIKK